jgi:integrase
MGEFKYLKREKKTGYWTYRRPIPGALQKVAGRKERSVSFGTEDLRAAKRAWPQVHVKIEAWLDKLRAELLEGAEAASDPSSRSFLAGTSRASDQRPLIDPRLCYARFEEWAQDKINQVFLEISSNGPEYDLFSAEHHSAADLVHALQSKSYRDMDALDAKLVGVLVASGINVPSDSPVLELLRRPFANAWMEVEAFRLKMNSTRRFVDPPPLPAPESRNPAQPACSLAPNGDAFMLLSELVEKAIDHAKMRERKTIARLNLVVRHIDDIVGHPARLNEVTKQVMIRLRDDAKYLPARPKDYERRMGFTKLVETMRASPDDTRPKMKDEAILPWFNLISPVFKYAVDHDYMASNPCDRIKPRVERAGEPKREPYTSDDLSKLFAEPMRDRPSQFWIPLIGAYTGARLNEIGQLEIADVVLGEVPYFRITDRSDEVTVRKKLKNANSRRIVPIHNVLLQAGIVDFVQNARGYRLFSDLPHPQTDADYECTKAFSQWFGRYRRKVGVTSARKPFHSFRHTFVRRALDCGVSGPLLSQIVGHESDPELVALLSRPMTRAYGGKSEELQRLQAEVDKVVYADFPAFERWSP